MSLGYGLYPGGAPTNMQRGKSVEAFITDRLAEGLGVEWFVRGSRHDPHGYPKGKADSVPAARTAVEEAAAEYGYAVRKIEERRKEGPHNGRVMLVDMGDPEDGWGRHRYQLQDDNGRPFIFNSCQLKYAQGWAEKIATERGWELVEPTEAGEEEES